MELILLLRISFELFGATVGVAYMFCVVRRYLLWVFFFFPILCVLSVLFVKFLCYLRYLEGALKWQLVICNHFSSTLWL